MSAVRLTEYENGSIGIYNGTTYKIVLEKHEVEALRKLFERDPGLPTKPGRYLDSDGEPWTLTNEGEWLYYDAPTGYDPADCLPFTKED